MSQAVQSPLLAMVESIARVMPRNAQQDFRDLMSSIIDNQTAQAPGGNLLQINGPKQGSSTAPVALEFSVSGANAQWSYSITNPSSPQGTAIYHEISYSPLRSFTQDVITLQPTVSTSGVIAAPGANQFFRIRSSYDKKTWSAYQFATTSSVNAGYIESGTMSSGAAFNQTNFAEVNSQAYNSAVAITINGTGGAFTPYTAVRGSTQATRPSATIVNVPPSTQQFIGWDGSQFQLKSTLAQVLADNLEPVGAVSVVSTATPSVPTISPVVVGGFIVGFSVTNGGNGASGPYTLTFGSTGGGTGATFGAQTIVNGVLISIAPGNPGSGYGGGTTVTASGGTTGGTGGGTAAGGNGGRMTAV